MDKLIAVVEYANARQAYLWYQDDETGEVFNRVVDLRTDGLVLGPRLPVRERGED